MEIHESFIVKRKDGVYVNVRLDPVKGIKQALRFNHVEDYENFIHGYYGPSDPENYYLQPIKITYEEVSQ